MIFYPLLLFLSFTGLAIEVGAAPYGPSNHHIPARIQPRNSTSKLVTWDADSIFIRGERVMIYSGEFHPFRLPVSGLWLDIFQKIKAAGFNGVSFYTNWALQEGSRGRIVTSGIWNLDEFFRAASEAGIYLLARPGPYINAEVAAGGLPGWILRNKGLLRSTDLEYLNSTNLYMETMGKIIAAAQVENGGPVILAQPENEYSTWPDVNATSFPDEMNKQVMAYAEKQLRDAGVTVPFVVNDNTVSGYFAPGTGVGAVDIYGIDAYPLRWSCSDPSVWPTYRWPTNWQLMHQQQSPTSPFSIIEFQGGAHSGWGGGSPDQCAALVNEQAVRVVYKNNYSFGVKLFNIYMTYGGTNWGNIGFHGAVTSYDYGAAITEDRRLAREKYSETKLQANFLMVSPAYLTAKPGNATNISDISVTELVGKGDNTRFYVVRHADWTSTERTNFNLTLNTSIGPVTLPEQEYAELTLDGRDSKVMVTDYDVGGINLIYCTAEIYTWAKGPGNQRVLVLYNDPGEWHEAAFPASLTNETTLKEGSFLRVFQERGLWKMHWTALERRAVVQLGSLEIYILPRNEAYNFWVMELPAPPPIGNYSSPSKELIILRGGYLIRSATIQGTELHVTGDLNQTTTFEVISAPVSVKTLMFNGKPVTTESGRPGFRGTVVLPDLPSISLPSFTEAKWKYIESLPEIHSSYSDSRWVTANQTKSTNPRALTTPSSLYASDYGFHSGSLIYRGHFIASGNETALRLTTNGGSGFGQSVWLNETFLGSWAGSKGVQERNSTLNITSAQLERGKQYVIIILIDHMGQDESAPGTEGYKYPRGILDFALTSHSATDIKWKLTGNYGGEDYVDEARGPRNEGGIWAERMGWHLPGAPSGNWTSRNPVTEGMERVGVGFFAVRFKLDVEEGWDVPMSFVFNGTGNSAKGSNYRVQLFVNGWQFGKYVNNIGPQTAFPVPEGILNYRRENYVALTLWALDDNGAKLGQFQLVPQAYVWSSYPRPEVVEAEGWRERGGY
ncbi:hypothetical protein GQ43DRAFT_433640 [Delitschia confertaspora ATCC 74209]|uniref:Beta-galactosidase n=1 Tax=Delitschia confertaspora ATCC 74209 TaxID=1513339 RepID=A0A9P4JLU1_9PLEO|nr:hypothetical protein GQ43DRAFT_433640 [Delitschia confertaspora ATCC 74209]